MTRSFGFRKPLLAPEGEWLRLSRDLTVASEAMGRDDFIVKIAPGAAYGDDAYDEHGKLRDDAVQHPALTFPEQGIIEIDGTWLPDGPQDARPLEQGDRRKYPVAWGLLEHETAHANFSRWVLTAGTLSEQEACWYGAAKTLEEPRAERRQLALRPQAQPWLQAAATATVLADLKQDLDGDGDMAKADLARAACLVLGRIDAESLDPDADTAMLENLVRGVFGDDFEEMRAIWREALDADDEDASAMLALGKRWHELTGDDDGAGAGEAIPVPAGLLEALEGLAERSRDEASGQGRRDRERERLRKVMRDRGTENKAARDAEQQAADVFHANPDPSSDETDSPVTGYRNPTPQETARARSTRRALQNAYAPQKATARVTGQLPPGRLLSRAARQAQSQLDRGVPVTAEPFMFKDRRRVRVPPLKVAIVQDVSGSQDRAAEAAASGAWSLAKAAEGIVDAQVAMVTFGDAVHAVLGPKDKVPRVPVLQTPGGSHHLKEALAAVEGKLGLMRPGTARVLVILTDGMHEAMQLAVRDPALLRLAKAGVRVLWFVTDGEAGDRHVPRLREVRTVDQYRGDFAAIPEFICREAVKTLETR